MKAKLPSSIPQMQTGGQYGMQTLERALAELVQQNVVSKAEALTKTSRPEELQRLLAG